MLFFISPFASNKDAHTDKNNDKKQDVKILCVAAVNPQKGKVLVVMMVVAMVMIVVMMVMMRVVMTVMIMMMICRHFLFNTSILIN